MSKTLGELTNVDVRQQWAREAFDFTPWLARPENMALLGKALGLELETKGTEVSVGPYSADILAQDSRGEYVVIENQLTKTDHDHLGKVLTYASVLGARSVIWIAPRFTDEHQKTLDWLNDHTRDDLSFFGVQVELWSIDNSPPAVRFNVVSEPAEIIRQAEASKSGKLSEVMQLQLDWWTAFRAGLLDKQIVTTAASPRAQAWFDVPLGRTGIFLSLTASSSYLGVRVYLHGKSGGDSALEQLSPDREAIEKEIGQSLEWNPKPDNKDKLIALYREVDLSDKKQWNSYRNWMLEMTQQFRAVFMPRVKDMELRRPEAETPEASD